MASTQQQHLLLSPAELAYLHITLSQQPPIRADGRTATQFRPLTAETGILPGTNGSARVCFADGTEAVVGIKAEVERTRKQGIDYAKQRRPRNKQKQQQKKIAEEEVEVGDGESEDGDEEGAVHEPTGDSDWVKMTVEIPGLRDDDSGTVFLATMLSEALLADGEFAKKLWINRRFHWKLYLDIILISSPLSYPLPLLSLTTHLALLATRLPRLKSEADEDPMFDDDWAASQFIYPRQGDDNTSPSTSGTRPPITLLVMAVGDNIIFDPSKEELAVADSALAVSVGETTGDADGAVDVDEEGKASRNLRLLSVRTIDPPSRLTAPGIPNAVNAAAWGQGAVVAKDPGARAAETDEVEGVWKAPRGGAKIAVLGAMVAKVLEKGGVADEVLEGLYGVELG
ncbi:Uu.00g074510.m01.CDS01 [Anthostomella pinea]|uniref:Ribosomal RNA-processing protein 42 n=1 Tax=Anthostomella pinea TaxID=933095 RepID=A0AAI8YP62_9PEZI|nr:Uu.00g074510.m01.CDS01 [Anthostomella pinea]